MTRIFIRPARAFRLLALLLAAAAATAEARAESLRFTDRAADLYDMAETSCDLAKEFIAREVEEDGTPTPRADVAAGLLLDDGLCIPRDADAAAAIFWRTLHHAYFIEAPFRLARWCAAAQRRHEACAADLWAIAEAAAGAASLAPEDLLERLGSLPADDAARTALNAAGAHQRMASAAVIERAIALAERAATDRPFAGAARAWLRRAEERAEALGDEEAAKRLVLARVVMDLAPWASPFNRRRAAGDGMDLIYLNPYRPAFAAIAHALEQRDELQSALILYYMAQDKGDTVSMEIRRLEDLLTKDERDAAALSAKFKRPPILFDF